MGDRRQVHIRQEGPESTALVLYTHWGGSELEEVIATAVADLRSAGRLDDKLYATRFIVDQMFKDCRDSVRGGGIGVGIEMETEYDDIFITWPADEWSAVPEVRTGSTVWGSVVAV